MKRTKCSFMYEGYLKVVVRTDIIVETSLEISAKLGFWICNLSEAILFRAVLSKTSTQSAHGASLLKAKNERYGCTTTSL